MKKVNDLNNLLLPEIKLVKKKELLFIVSSKMGPS